MTAQIRVVLIDLLQQFLENVYCLNLIPSFLLFFGTGKQTDFEIFFPTVRIFSPNHSQDPICGGK